MNKPDAIKTISDIIEDVKFAMITTVSHEGHLHACPMTTNQSNLEAKEIWFIGAKNTETVSNIKQNPQINLAYANQDNKDYVSINGTAKIIEDEAKLDELWSPVYNVFFENGKQDANVQLIKVVPHGAEFWKGGNGLVNIAKMAVAAIQDEKVADKLGENGSIEF